MGSIVAPHEQCRGHSLDYLLSCICLGAPSHQGTLSEYRKTLYHSRDSRGLRSSYVRNQGQRPNVVTKDVPDSQEITRVLGALPGTRNQGQRPDTYFLLGHNITGSDKETKKEGNIYLILSFLPSG